MTAQLIEKRAAIARRQTVIRELLPPLDVSARG